MSGDGRTDDVDACVTIGVCKNDVARMRYSMKQCVYSATAQRALLYGFFFLCRDCCCYSLARRLFFCVTKVWGMETPAPHHTVRGKDDPARSKNSTKSRRMRPANKAGGNPDGLKQNQILRHHLGKKSPIPRGEFSLFFLRRFGCSEVVAPAHKPTKKSCESHACGQARRSNSGGPEEQRKKKKTEEPRRRERQGPPC